MSAVALPEGAIPARAEIAAFNFYADDQSEAAFRAFLTDGERELRDAGYAYREFGPVDGQYVYAWVRDLVVGPASPEPVGELAAQLRERD